MIFHHSRALASLTGGSITQNEPNIRLPSLILEAVTKPTKNMDELTQQVIVFFFFLK